MNTWRKLIAVVVVGWAALWATKAAVGAAISINLASDVEFASLGGPTTAVGANVAGVVPVGNWNDVPLAQQTNRPLVDHLGATVPGLTLSTTQPYVYPGSAYDATNTNFAAAGNTSMMRGHIYQPPAGGNVDLVFTGSVPYGVYDLYVYYNSGGITSTQTMSILDGGGGSLGLSQVGFEVPGADIVFTQSNSSGANNANYVKFTGLTGTSVPANFIVRTSGSQYKLVNGLQFVESQPPPAGPVWDLEADFSQTSGNPNGAWTYGSAPNIAPGYAMSAYTTPSVLQTLELWHTTPYDPNVGHNSLDTDIVPTWTARYPAHTATAGPGPAGVYSGYRFTAPADGWYKIDAEMFNVVTGGNHATTDVHVIRNATAELFGAGINPGNPSADFHSLSVRLSAGETVDFIVGDGGNGHGNDNTAVRGQVTRVAKPAGWNLEADFSLTGGNPNGAWSYGSAPNISPGYAVTPYNTGETLAAIGAPDVEIWHSAGAWDPNVTHNPLDTPVTTPWYASFTPHTTAFHPGPGGLYSLYRWTAPADGYYLVDATMFNAVTRPTGERATTDVHVILNATTELFVDALNPGNLSTDFHSGRLSLLAGDTIDFLVGDGGNGYINDSTGILAQITFVPEPTTSTLALIGLGALGALVVRRRKR